LPELPCRWGKAIYIVSEDLHFCLSSLYQTGCTAYQAVAVCAQGMTDIAQLADGGVPFAVQARVRIDFRLVVVKTFGTYTTSFIADSNNQQVILDLLHQMALRAEAVEYSLLFQQPANH